MKKILSVVLSLFVMTSLSAQLVITEIMFNPPESGQDSLEYIEIYNNSGMAIDMENYAITEGVGFTFPAHTVGAGEYVIIAGNATAFTNNFGMAAFEWESGSTSNGGEDIVLADVAGMTIDSVDYDDNDAWPAGTDSEGASLVLCDIDGDNNDPANWESAATDAGFSINGRQIYGNPGAASQCVGGTQYKLTRYSATVGEGDGSVTVIVKVENPSDAAVPQTVTLAVSGSSSASDGMDYMFMDTVLTYEGVTAPFFDTITVNIIDDAIEEGDETIILTLSNPVNGTVGAASASITITVEDDDEPEASAYPPYTIGMVTSGNADGVVDSSGVQCQIQGVVYGVNMRPSGLQFTIIDGNNDGIGLFSGSAQYGYTVNEGDEVIIQGTIGQFNGLIQISPDTVWMVSTGNDLFDATVVTTFDETTESQLIKLENLNFVDVNDWQTSGSFNIEVTDGTNTFAIRVDSDVNISGTDAPAEPFNLTGLGGQFDNSSPYTSGYQIFPRYLADIEDVNDYTDPNYPAYPIGVVTAGNADGVTDSLDVVCQIQGIVYGVNMRPSGLQFTIIDENNDGIGLFSFDTNYGYTVNEGDEVIIRGEISQFNGLTQISPDTVFMLSAANDLFDPTVIMAFDETTESQLIKLENLTFVDVNDWQTSGSFNIDVTDGTNTFAMRVDSDVNVSGTDAPAEPFNLTGLGGQFDNSSPFTGGYQILPRYIEDIETIFSGSAIRFIGTSVDVNEDAGMVEIGIEYPPGDFVAWDATVSLDMGNSSTILDLDFNFVDTTFELSGFGIDTVYFSVQITDDMLAEDVENIHLVLTSNNPGVDPSFDRYDIYITDNEEAAYPAYPIGVVTAEGASGIPDSLDVVCQIQGIVYGVNMRPSGLQFTTIDSNNDGIGLFSFENNFGYTVNEGDEVIIQGTISQFNGLTQISPDTIWMVSSENALFDATVITVFDETTESQLIKLENMSLVDPNEWQTSGSFNIDVTDGTNTFAMRIDSDVNISGTNAPLGFFNLTGIGGQFDSEEPYDSGYQILPRYMLDIDPIDGVNDVNVVETAIYPNPVSDIVVIKTAEVIDGIKLFNALGQQITVEMHKSDIYHLDMRTLPKGLYFVNLFMDGAIWTKAVVKE